MDRLPLPVLDPLRTEFGFERTQCACPACQSHCQHLPGYLIPADVARIAAYHRPDMDIPTWAQTYLLASPGALVIRQGKLLRLRTLVPARRSDGACIFLTPDGACSIHPVAPFGCAFFDDHISKNQADRRSIRGLHAVDRAWQTASWYAVLWAWLRAIGRCAPAPEKVRRQLRDESARK